MVVGGGTSKAKKRTRVEEASEAYSQRLNAGGPAHMSDDLVLLRDIIEWANARKMSVERLPRLNLIIDTSCALQELDRRFRFQKPDARTGLEETEACGLVRMFGPDFLDQEVRAKLPSFSVKRKIPVDWLRAAWDTYRQRIRLFPARRAANVSVRDVEDLPFLYAQELIGADAIVTADKDILESTASAFTPNVIHDPLRTYARSKAVTLMMGTQTMGGVLVSGEAIKGLVDQVRKRPWLALLGVGLFGALAYWDKKQMEQNGTSTLREAWRLGTAVTKAAFEKYRAAAQDATAGWAKVEEALRARPPISLTQRILATCIWHGRALTEREIHRDLAEAGYREMTTRAASQAEISGALNADLRFRFQGNGWVCSLVPEVLRPRRSAAKRRRSNRATVSTAAKGVAQATPRRRRSRRTQA